MWQFPFLESSDAQKIIDKILEEPDTENTDWSKIGIGLQVDEIGLFKLTLLYAAS